MYIKNISTTLSLSFLWSQGLENAIKRKENSFLQMINIITDMIDKTKHKLYTEVKTYRVKFIIY